MIAISVSGYYIAETTQGSSQISIAIAGQKTSDIVKGTSTVGVGIGGAAPPPPPAPTETRITDGLYINITESTQGIIPTTTQDSATPNIAGGVSKLTIKRTDIPIISATEIITQATQTITTDTANIAHAERLRYQCKVEDILFTYGKYYELANLTFDELAQHRFLTDYFVIKTLAEFTALERRQVARVLVGLSNIFRIAKDNDIGEIHAVSIRFKRAGNYYVAVEF